MALTDDQKAQIEAQRAEAAPTRRATVPALEEILYQPLPVLDHGFVRVVDYMGDDGAIVQAARVSYGQGTRHVSSDRGLINYLMRHRHTSPFEMCELKLHVKLPIFVARQWIRHRTANVNEYSARYSVVEDQVYLPEPAQMAAQARTNRQGRGEALPEATATAFRERLRQGAADAFAAYRDMLQGEGDEAPGLARELARIGLPLNTYSEWYWKTDLHNLLHFIGLRADSHAQYEIRAYAEVLQDIVRRWVPLTAAAFAEYRLGAALLSATALDVLRRMLGGESVTQAESGLAAGEWRELMRVLGRETG
ncbi:MAG TPA: FAD-dependent thymidylate synthase [Geminicoccaceae bacterium]|nr:FAD-dependent thymidylate synthase [Geminicoccus sp.]HMU50810.1 FAD-dependent thymidylate synthase [Geminicoccaceae bacterium]